jgi:lipopolysaccharide transport system ATP-binding protein
MGSEFIKIKSVGLVFKEQVLQVNTEFNIEIEFWNLSDFEEINVGFDLFHVSGTNVFSTGSQFVTKRNAINKVQCTVPGNFLNNDMYSIYLMFFSKNMMPLFAKEDIITFEVEDTVRDSNHTGKINGVIRPKLKWAYIE